jgi:hypothetical protein
MFIPSSRMIAPIAQGEGQLRSMVYELVHNKLRRHAEAGRIPDAAHCLETTDTSDR